MFTTRALEPSARTFADGVGARDGEAVREGDTETDCDGHVVGKATTVAGLALFTPEPSPSAPNPLQANVKSRDENS